VDVADILDTPTPLRASLLAWLNGRQGPQSVLAAGVAVLVAAGATVALRSADPASADTKVVVARLAQVYLPDGSNHPAVEGEVLPRGAELHTGDGGGAQLTTAGRRVYVGGLSTLVVRDGVREELARGQAMVDARDGAHLELTTPAGTVSTPAGAVSRVEEDLLTRVAAYHGTVTLHPVGRSSATAVPALHQLKVQPQSLPQRTTPLQLTRKRGLSGTLEYDAWERAVVADLVSADQDLQDLADGLSHEEGATYLATVPASFRSGAVPAVGAARGEEALTVAVARAAAAPDALAQVRADRADLGSWGVVAALVRARVSDVSAVLTAALTPGTSPNGSNNGTTVNAGPVPNLPGVVPVGSPSPSTSRGPTTGPTTRPTTRPTTPTTSAPATETVTGLVTTVLTLVSPSPAPAQRPSTPSPTPTPPCVLNLLLC
jgi:hypothetical protein